MRHTKSWAPTRRTSPAFGPPAFARRSIGTSCSSTKTSTAWPAAARNGTSSAERPATPLGWGGHGLNQARRTRRVYKSLLSVESDPEPRGLTPRCSRSALGAANEQVLDVRDTDVAHDRQRNDLAGEAARDLLDGPTDVEMFVRDRKTGVTNVLAQIPHRDLVKKVVLFLHAR